MRLYKFASTINLDYERVIIALLLSFFIVGLIGSSVTLIIDFNKTLLWFFFIIIFTKTSIILIVKFNKVSFLFLRLLRVEAIGAKIENIRIVSNNIFLTYLRAKVVSLKTKSKSIVILNFSILLLYFYIRVNI